ncbi:two-component system, response regulator YesN [Paenibacillus catalpae]|uniref:Two-component system, response regulator YesN n=1 Tax=Paenibacillus catalpae TaxID=1045775 RepID=A0A1I1XLY6_9BACL|nr:response regulator [Paenibacillus catalpae]SFE08352.1 two-component system, response regulator YesN [Paenibacillus catalpae]
MLTAVIFDDEYIVTQGLQVMVDWSRYGIELIGTASDGISALQMVRELQPDIVMTDIRMPGLTGLQLIEEIAKEKPETACIVFSGFNEFEYIRTALKLGVIDYLDKPITLEKIDEAMRRTIARIGRQQEHVQMKTQLAANKEALLEKATLDLLLLGEEAVPAWRTAFGEGDAKQAAAVTVLAATGKGEWLDEHPSYRSIPFYYEKMWIMVVIHFMMPADYLWEHLTLLSPQMQETIGSGQTYANIAEAGQSYKEAVRALRYGVFLEEKGWNRFEHAEDTFPHGLTECEEEIVFCMRTGNKEGLLRLLDEYKHCMEAERLSPELVEQEVTKLAYIGYQVAMESGEDVRTSARPIVPHWELGEMSSRDRMFQWLREQMEQLHNFMKEDKQATKHNAIEKALAFIDKHYLESFTLQEVAEHVGMNATYLSLLFKEKVGLSYIKYVTKLRMEQAKILLHKGMLVNDVSKKVGYYNYRHFTELFKKYTGVTPGQFREGHGMARVNEIPGNDEQEVGDHD